MQQTVRAAHVELLHARSHEQVENCVTQLLQTGFVLFTQFRNGLPVLLPCASPQPRLASSRPERPAPAMGHPVQISETSSIAVYPAIGEHTHCHPSASSVS